MKLYFVTNNATFGIPVGVFVNSVTEGLAAEKAGIRKGYVITKFDGYSITTIAQLQERLQYYEEGEKVDVVVMVLEGTLMLIQYISYPMCLI